MAKTARYNLYIFPELHEKLKELSYLTGISMNELINQSIREYIESRSGMMEEAADLLKMREQFLAKKPNND